MKTWYKVDDTYHLVDEPNVVDSYYMITFMYTLKAICGKQYNLVDAVRVPNVTSFADYWQRTASGELPLPKDKICFDCLRGA